jgi:hypothetical protein
MAASTTGIRIPSQKFANRCHDTTKLTSTSDEIFCESYPNRDGSMKSKFTQRRYRALKRSSCTMCKPQKQGWADKKTFAEVRQAVAHEQEYDMRERR